MDNTMRVEHLVGLVVSDFEMTIEGSDVCSEVSVCDV